FGASGGGLQVAVEEGRAAEADGPGAPHLDRARGDPGEALVGDVGAGAVAGAAAQYPVSARKRTVVDRDRIGERAGLEARHPRVRFIDRVPAEARLQASDRPEALARVELQRAVDVVLRDRDDPLGAVDRLAELPARDAERGVRGETSQQRLVPLGRQLDVAVELRDVGEGVGLDALQAVVEGVHLHGLDQPVLAADGSLRGLQDGHEVELALQATEDLERVVARAVVHDDPAVGRATLCGDRADHALDVPALVVHRRDDEQPLRHYTQRTGRTARNFHTGRQFGRRLARRKQEGGRTVAFPDMCGICGIAGREKTAPALDRERLLAMTDAIVHRGPDEAGLHVGPGVALGMRRLSIIDVGGSHQPIANEDSTVLAVFNGEIYNFRELRAGLRTRGHRLATEGDGEVIVHLYEEHGLDFAKHLEGIFAIALWDAPRGRLVLVRDQLGVKPLYCALGPEGLSFASEVKSLIAGDLLEPALDPLAAELFLALGFVPGSRSLFKGVEKVLPASMVVWEGDGEVRQRSYWTSGDGVPARPAGASWEEDQERLLELLRSATRAQMVSDVPLGSMLSGGLDSSLITALMAESSS